MTREAKKPSSVDTPHLRKTRGVHQALLNLGQRGHMGK